MKRRAKAKAAKAHRRRAAAYEAHKEFAAERQRTLSLSARDIGEIPPVANPKRREACRRNFRLFCETYFGALFYLAWSADHLRVIAKIEVVALEGGMLAIAMPRATGKSTLLELAILWAALYGHRLYGVIISADGDRATAQLDTIKSHLKNNDLLLEDFPEVCYPIRRLEGITQRAVGQLSQGAPTLMVWTADRIILPTVKGSAASGAIIQCMGITAGIRGLKHQRPDGTNARPDFALVDDPQTDESARSPSQCAQRESIITGAIMGLAGPGKKIAAFATVTVVCEGDLADSLLSHDRHPEWQGERTKLLNSLPADEKLWGEYDKLRRIGHTQGRGLKDATEFYRKHRAAMDEGAVASWPARYEPDQLSAVQYAMTIKLEKPQAFWAEYQNDPAAGAEKRDDELSADAIAAKVSNHARALVPTAATRLTMFVDVMGKALYWLVAAWEDDFTGYVVDYGTEPDQRTGYFTLRDIRRTLALAAPKDGPEAATFAGLERLMAYTVGREWKRDDGQIARISRCLIDAGDQTDLVYRFCRQSTYGPVLTPSHGMGIGPDRKPISEYQRRPGERHGLAWYMPLAGKRQVRHVLFDANFWKTFLQKRLSVGLGDPGSLSLFGGDAGEHRMLSDHLTAEYRVPTVGRGRTVDVWKLRPARENHFLDCVVGASVAAAMEGVTLPTMRGSERPRERRKISHAELAAKRRVVRVA